MAKLIFEDEDVKSHANMDYIQNGGHAQQNGIPAPVEAENADMPSALCCGATGERMT